MVQRGNVPQDRHKIARVILNKLSEGVGTVSAQPPSRLLRIPCWTCNILLDTHGGIQIIWYGQKHKGEAEPILCGILKTWLCGICYLHQQYKEHGCTDDPGKMISTCMKPSQIEMS